MEAKMAQGVQLGSIWIDPDKFGPRKPSCSVRFSGWRRKEVQGRLRVNVSASFDSLGRKEKRRLSSLEVSCSYQNSQASILESGSVHALFDEGLALQSKSQEIEPHLNGHCIYLVGLMGSGKTTVGKILAQAVGYTFFDCDTLIEQSVDGTSVAEIFKIYGEDFFREKETEALKKLSIMHRLVVSTGGGAVVRPINWRYMQKGISVWLDVPLEALAKRIAAVGTASRPLLHHESESGDAYTKALKRLCTLFEERYDAYASANARVSLENIAAKLGHHDVSRISPTEIALEALEQIGKYLQEDGGSSRIQMEL